MTYTNKNEELRPPEAFQDGEEQELPPHARLTPARVEEVFVQRKRMLASITTDIEPRFHEALLIKMNYEHNSLLELVEADKKALDAKRGANKVLNAQYFVQKPLENRTF